MIMCCLYEIPHGDQNARVKTSTVEQTKSMHVDVTLHAP